MGSEGALKAEQLLKLCLEVCSLFMHIQVDEKTDACYFPSWILVALFTLRMNVLDTANCSLLPLFVTFIQIHVRNVRIYVRHTLSGGCFSRRSALQLWVAKAKCVPRRCCCRSSLPQSTGIEEHVCVACLNQRVCLCIPATAGNPCGRMCAFCSSRPVCLCLRMLMNMYSLFGFICAPASGPNP